MPIQVTLATRRIKTAATACVRMRNADVAELYDAVPPGTPVWIEE